MHIHGNRYSPGWNFAWGPIHHGRQANEAARHRVLGNIHGLILIRPSNAHATQQVNDIIMHIRYAASFELVQKTVGNGYYEIKSNSARILSARNHSDRWFIDNRQCAEKKASRPGDQI